MVTARKLHLVSCLLLLTTAALPQAAQWPTCPTISGQVNFSVLALKLDSEGQLTGAEPLAGDAAFLQSAASAAQGLNFAAPIEGSTLGLFCITTTTPGLGYIFDPEALRGTVPPRHLAEAAALAHLTHQTAPQYPAMARARNIRGPVVLTVVIGAKGEVAAAVPSSGPPELLHAAMAAVRQWRFTPFAGGDVITTLHVRFLSVS